MLYFFLFIFLFSVGNTLLSQQGKATYSVKTSLGDDFKLNSRIPKQVAERIKKFVDIVGHDRVIGGTDCGFGTFAGFGAVDPDIAYAKLKSLAEGASLVK